jgi:hypothetical protein
MAVQPGHAIASRPRPWDLLQSSSVTRRPLSAADARVGHVRRRPSRERLGPRALCDQPVKPERAGVDREHADFVESGRGRISAQRGGTHHRSGGSGQRVAHRARQTRDHAPTVGCRSSTGAGAVDSSQQDGCGAEQLGVGTVGGTGEKPDLRDPGSRLAARTRARNGVRRFRRTADSRRVRRHDGQPRQC